MKTMLCGVVEFKLESSHLYLENQRLLWILWWSVIMMLMSEEVGDYIFLGSCPSGIMGSLCGWRRWGAVHCVRPSMMMTGVCLLYTSRCV